MRSRSFICLAAMYTYMTGVSICGGIWLLSQVTNGADDTPIAIGVDVACAIFLLSSVLAVFRLIQLVNDWRNDFTSQQPDLVTAACFILSIAAGCFVAVLGLLPAIFGYYLAEGIIVATIVVYAICGITVITWDPILERSI